MKIEFEDKSSIEVKRSDEPGKVVVIVSANDDENPLKRIINTVEITDVQFKELAASVVKTKP